MQDQTDSDWIWVWNGFGLDLGSERIRIRIGFGSDLHISTQEIFLTIYPTKECQLITIVINDIHSNWLAQSY